MRAMPKMGDKIRMLVDTALVKSTSLKGQIGFVTVRYPGDTFKHEGELIEKADCIEVQFDVPTGYQDCHGEEGHGLILHCDEPERWEVVK